MNKFVIGIDEVGRGPLAGPVTVGAVCVPGDFDWGLIPGVGDSKRVSSKNRFAIFRLAKKLKQTRLIDYEVVSVSAKQIDKKGIVSAINEALGKAIQAVTTRVDVGLAKRDFEVRLDGGLRAPVVFVRQETIVKGDAKELVIGLASIIAKVTRDGYMERLARRAEFTLYDFNSHKGYGTKKHRSAILRHGLSKQHRVSFCRKLMT